MTNLPQPTTGANRSTEKQNWLVFTSAGDHSAVAQWLAGRHYDIMVVYYGTEPEAFPYRDLVDVYRPRKGCKFCNLKYYHETEPETFKKYTAIMVIDDDIQITADALNRLFTIREKYDLWITTPAMKPQYHSPWYDSLSAITPQTRVRIVPFIEMDCPMFRADKLWEFVDTEFDPIIKGWGKEPLYFVLCGLWFFGCYFFWDFGSFIFWLIFVAVFCGSLVLWLLLFWIVSFFAPTSNS